MKHTIIFILTLSLAACQGQQNTKFNFGFEKQNSSEGLSDGWIKWGNYELSIDNQSHSGDKSGKITSDHSGSSFGSIAYQIPANYAGDQIQLKGYMKLRDVKDGFAGLLLRIDGNGGSLAFDNMQRQNISGTKDWHEYTITLDYPDEAEKIFIAGILSGKGEAWFDDFVLSIDGQNVELLKEVEREMPKALFDRSFDNGSSITITDLSTKKIDNLELLGRVWGFLKYHHPEIGAGNLNWDYELFRFLPKYLKVSKAEERDQSLVNWISSLGELKECPTCQSTKEEAYLKADLAWIESQSTTLREKLREVHQKRHQGKQFYIGSAANVGNPEFRNENAYSHMPYPDDGFRLLSLYRYWNMIQYYFPYRHLTDKDWNGVLREYIPKFLHAKDELEYELAALELIGDVQDTHANLWGGADKIREWKGGYFAPFHLRFIEEQLVVTDYYNPELKTEAGLEIGDVITSINGQSIEELIQEKSKYYPASNVPTRLRDISADILRSKGNKTNITYYRDKKEYQRTIALYPRERLDIYRWYRRNEDLCYKLLEDNIGYITLESIKDEDISIIKEKFEHTKGIIIDIRNYPSTFVPFSLGSYFMSSPTSFVKFTTGDTDNPGEFSFTEELKIPTGDITYQGKVIVLLNELSQSQAEYTAMAFRAANSITIVGSTTAGADGNVSTIFLPGGLRTMISGIGVHYPDGTETQRVGIIPDVQIEPTIQGIIDGKDELLEEAIKLILKE